MRWGLWRWVMGVVAMGAAALGAVGLGVARGQAAPPAATTTRAGGAARAYQDTTLSFEKRVADLVGRLTLEEKANEMLMTVTAGSASEVSRLGVPPVCWWTEAIHGVSRAGRATVFPQAIGMAAAWDPPLMQMVADAIATEARAKIDPAGSQYRGITIWAPTINMARDPRWGRLEETYGEDPYLTGRLAVSFVKGLQGDDPKYLKTVATPKHFAMYSQETQRASSSFDCPEAVLRDYYLPAFRECFVEGKAVSAMAAFNGVNKVPATANAWLLTDVLRREWGFEGAVVTDCDAVMHLMQQHRYVSTMEQAVTAAIKAGVDVISYWPEGQNGMRTRDAIVQAVERGMLEEAMLDRAVSRNLLLRFRLGMFDPPAQVPFARTAASMVGAKEHQALALQAALESVVLLKNEPAPPGHGYGKLLPLDLRRIDSLALLGAYAQNNYYGAYSGDPANTAPTLAAALRAVVGDRVTIRTETSTDTELNIKAARESNVVIFACGLNGDIEKEGTDRSSLLLPAAQQTLLEKVIKANPLTIVLLEGGSPIAVEAIKEKVPAMMMLWYPGEQGAVAVARLLLGQANPSGKLPVTFYRSSDDLPALADYDIRKGRTYMYATKPPTYAFGAGLSYTTFAYADVRVTPEAVSATGTVTVKLEVSNTGKMDGDEVVQLYVREKQPKVQRPIKQLKGFQRVTIAQGKKREVTFTLAVANLGFWDMEAKAYVVDKGGYEVLVGSSSDDIRGKGEFTVE